MTGTLQFIDCSTPLENWPANTPEHNPIDGIAFYIGGDTPHVWTVEELEKCPYRYRLPIFVRDNMSTANPQQDAAYAIVQLKNEYMAPEHTVLAIDTETSADPGYIRAFYEVVNAAGYTLIDYGSQAYLFQNENPDGYYWGADWLVPPDRAVQSGEVGTQYLSMSTFDEDIMSTIMPFWDTYVAVPELPPGQWNNPKKWYWRTAQITGVGLNGTTYTFTYNPVSGLWAGPT
jgi:hypothetical protein